jgi:hypothetical protein
MAIVTLENGLSPMDNFAGKSSSLIITLMILIMTGTIGLAYAGVSPSPGVVDESVPQFVQLTGP